MKFLEVDNFLRNYLQKQPPEVFWKKVFFKISKTSQESICVGVSF